MKKLLLLVLLLSSFFARSQDTLDYESIQSSYEKQIKALIGQDSLDVNNILKVVLLRDSIRDNQVNGKTVLAKKQQEKCDSIIKKFFPVGKTYCMPLNCPLVKNFGSSDWLFLDCLGFNNMQFYFSFFHVYSEAKHLTDETNYTSLSNTEIIQNNMGEKLYCWFEVIKAENYPFWEMKKSYLSSFGGCIPIKILRVIPPPIIIE